MTQELIIWIVFGLAVLFVGRKIYMDFSADSDCAKGCGACDMAKDKPS
jgi:hypothetical protein